MWISRSRSATAASPPADRRISPRRAASRRSNSDPGKARAAGLLERLGDRLPAGLGRSRPRAPPAAPGAASARSLPSAAARSSSSSGRRAPVRQVLQQILDRVSLGQPVDQLHLLDRDRRLVGDRRRDLALLGVDATVAGIAQRQDADQLVGGHHRHHHGRIRVVAPQRDGQPAAGLGAAAAGRQRQLHAELVHVQRRAARAAAPARPRRAQARGRRHRPPARRSTTPRAGAGRAGRRPAAGSRAWTPPTAPGPGRTAPPPSTAAAGCPRRAARSRWRPPPASAAWTRKSESARVNSRGASACSAITPITWPALACSGAAHSDWYFSSSASGTTLARGSSGAFSGMKTAWLCSATHPARPSPGSNRSRPASAEYGIGHRPQHQPVVVGIDEVDPAGMAVDGFADQIDDRAQHPVEVERRGRPC